MGISERKERNARRMRQAILDAALDLFSEGGADNVTMRAIAERIEYSPATIYTYFENKERILRELCLAAFDTLEERMRTLDGIPDPLERLRAGCAAYIDFALAHPKRYEIMFGTPADHGQEDPAAQSDLERSLASFNGLVRVVGECMAAGHLPAGDPTRTAAIIWSSLHGMSLLLINQLFAFLPPDIRDDIVEHMLAFLLREEGRTP
jgi:AcrR family transcriptional regulator